MNCVNSVESKKELHRQGPWSEEKSQSRQNKKMLEEMAEKAEEAAEKNEKGTLYKITNTICGKKHKKSVVARTKHGKLLTQEDEVKGRWEHFNEVLNIPCNVPAETLEEDLQATEDLENINPEPPTREEIWRECKTTKLLA